MNWKSLLFLFALGFCQVGCMCMSTKVSEEIKGYSQDTTEFVPSSNGFVLYKGYRVEVENNASNSFPFLFAEYHFPAVLQSGGQRILQVYIPAGTGFPARVTETTQAGKPLAEAVLVIMGSAENRNPANYLARRFPEFEPSRAGATVVVLSKPYTLEEMDHFLFVGTHASDGKVEWIKVPSDIHLQWQVRSRMRLFALRCKYIYTVPIDIVTFPFQLIMVNAKMAKWVSEKN